MKRLRSIIARQLRYNSSPRWGEGKGEGVNCA